MSRLLLFFFCSLTTLCFSQKIIVIDRNEDTESIFDDNNPASLISLIRANETWMPLFDMNGIEDSIVAKMSEEEKSSIFAYKGPEPDIPLIDDDPSSINFGEPLIRENEDGLLEYVYPPAEMLYLDLKAIDRIVLRYSGGEEKDSEPFIERFELWKKMGGQLVRVADLDARNLLTYDGFKIIRSASEEWNRKIIGPQEAPTLWEVARDTAMNRLKYVQGMLQKDLYYEYASNGIQEFYITDPHWGGLFGGNGPSNVHNVEDVGLSYWSPYYEEDWGDYLPFETFFVDVVKIDTLDESMNFPQFDSVYYTIEQSNIPLIDWDPESENFGMEMTIVKENGLEYYLYPAPEIIYFWVDYDPVVFISEGIYYDSVTGNSVSVPEMVYFCLQYGDGKPYLISQMNVESNFASFFVDYPKFDTSELEWNLVMKKEIENKKNRYDLSNQKSLKKLNKRDKKL